MIFWMLYMYLVSSKDFKGCHDLISGVRVGRLARHKVNEGLECNHSQSVRIHNAHDAAKLRLSLYTEKQVLKITMKTVWKIVLHWVSIVDAIFF